MNMRTVFFSLFLIFCAIATYSQSFSKEELDRYSNQGSMSDEKKARELAQAHPLNDQKELSLSCIKEYPGQSKLELFRKIHNWVVGFSSDSKSAIQVADTSTWTIQTRCYFSQIASRTMGDNRYRVNIRPLLRFDFKEGRIRFIYTIQSYDVLKVTDHENGIFSKDYLGVFDGGGINKDNQVWPLSECFPYSDNPSHPKVTSSRALVNSIASYKILIDRIDDILKKKDDENW